VQVEPMVEDHLGINFPGEFVVLPRVLLTDGFGRVHDRAGSITARLRGGRLFGDTVVALDSGRAQFTHLIYRNDRQRGEIRPIQMDFVGPWYTRPASVRLRGAWNGAIVDNFLVRTLLYNDRPLEPPFEAQAEFGDSLRFDMLFEYTTQGATANYIVAAAPMWGDRTRATIRLAGLPRPVQEAWRSVTFSVPPPPTPGEHYIVLLFGAEDTADHMFSSTSWSTGAPRWNDGNDVADAGSARFEELRRTGWLVVPGYTETAVQLRQAEAREGARVWERDTVLARDRRERSWKGTAIRVIVRP
jgi:hypothetical protein